MIPYKNVPALIAYYLGIFSFIPLFGLAAFILGIMGLRLRARFRVPDREGAYAGSFDEEENFVRDSHRVSLEIEPVGDPVVIELDDDVMTQGLEGDIILEVAG